MKTFTQKNKINEICSELKCGCFLFIRLDLKTISGFFAEVGLQGSICLMAF
jgi:hypothetical protein